MAKMRYPLLDGFRGFFLLFMTIIHANEILETVAGKLNHHYFGWVEDAQGFVFISGFVVALVYGRALDRKGFAGCVSATYSRIRTIWTYQALLILLFLAAAVLLPVTQESTAFRPYIVEPAGFTLASLGLVAASRHMGILPMYIFFMAVLPFVLVWLSRGHWPAVLVGSMMVWLVGQTRLLPYAVDQLKQYLLVQGVELPLGLFFNMLSWQILFFAGSILGYHLNRQTLPLHLFQTEMFRAVAWVCFWSILALGLFDRLVYWDLLPPDWTASFLEMNQRRNFGPLHLLAFAVSLFFATWVLMAGLTDRNPLVRTIGRLVHGVVSQPLLIFLGQHSLQVFAFQMVLVYALAVIFRHGPPSELVGTLVLLTCAASLYLPAQLHALYQARRKIAVQT